MQLLLSGSVPDEEIVAFLAALRDKGEQADELVGFAEVMRAHAAETLLAAGVEVESISHREPLLDTCGTGGDGRGRSTSRRRPHWLRQRRESAWPSTATAQFQAVVEAPTCWKPWAWPSTCRWNEYPSALTRSAWFSSWRPACTSP